MRVLTVNTCDIRGGAARAAFRLHQALLAAGVESRMLVQSKSGGDDHVLSPETTLGQAWAKLRPKLDSLPTRFYPHRSQTPFSPAWVPFSMVVDRINALSPDIVHLHWVAEGMLSAADLGRIRPPVVWSLHDMWPFTGGCHYDEGCGGFRQECGTCRVLGSAKGKDLSRNVWSRKSSALAKKQDMVVVGLSNWLAGCAKDSSLLGSRDIRVLPNPIDTELFRPVDPYQARQRLGLPPDVPLILFGAVNATADPRKGFPQLGEALSQLHEEGIELAVVGGDPGAVAPFGLKVHHLGTLTDDVSLTLAYSAADVVVVPSLQENLSNVIMESMACGTPVAAFNIGGNGDLIDHRTSGYLAEFPDTADLAAGIDWLIRNNKEGALSRNAVKKIETRFDKRVVAPQYIALYRELLNSPSDPRG